MLNELEKIGLSVYILRELSYESKLRKSLVNSLRKFDDKGCIAVKTKHGKALADYTQKLQRQIGKNGVQLVTISRPSAYGEYEPYEIMENKEKFQERVLEL